MGGAAQRIAAERARAPRVVALAEAAALAARVEPELLLALRLRCVPGADASVEADLWFGPLAGVRSPGVLALDGEIVTELRRGVALDLRGPMEAPGAREHVEAIAAVIARVHAGAPPLLRLEEELIAGLVLGRDPEELDLRLRSVLGAMAHQHARRSSLASWAWAALPRLPLDHMVLPSAGALCVATGLTMQQPMPVPPRMVAGALACVPAELAEVTGHVELAVSRTGPWLVLSHVAEDDAAAAVPPRRRIRLPATTPRYVEVSTGSGDATLVALPPGGTERVRVDGAPELRLRTLDGKEWKVARARTASPDAPSLPPLAHASARTCFELLQDGRSVALWGPGDSDVEGTAKLVMAHLARAGFSPHVVGSEAELALARAARRPRAVYGTRDPRLLPRLVREDLDARSFASQGAQLSGEETFFYWLAPHEDPTQLDDVARLVQNEDLTLEEALARYATANPENVRTIHDRTAGVIGIMDRFFEGLTDAELARWLWDALATDDVGVLALYRELLDGHPSRVHNINTIEDWRLVASGLFRSGRFERNRWYRELLGHRWIDAQLERPRPWPAPRYVLVLGTSTTAQQVAHALGARGRDYGLVVLGHEPAPQDALVLSYFAALPAEVPRGGRVQVILDTNAPAVTKAISFGATLVPLDGEEPQRIVARAHAVVDARGPAEHEGSQALVDRARSSGLPIVHADPREAPEAVATRALELLDRAFSPAGVEHG
ncbi:MAG TPA: hypothetical protein VK932_19705 [Kofleriaceae bacterium]|nr:hypothetical protein [Kofleriaceae bacterium]